MPGLLEGYCKKSAFLSHYQKSSDTAEGRSAVGGVRFEASGAWEEQPTAVFTRNEPARPEGAMAAEWPFLRLNSRGQEICKS